VEVRDDFTSNFELRPLCPEYNPGVHSIINVCGACFESAGGLVNSTIHRIWTFVGNVSYEEASLNCLCGCPRLVQEQSSSSGQSRISNSSQSRGVVAVKTSLKDTTFCRQ
jgi:hypothetical protein